ncbi:MAG: YkgJ family cysteine cluster protein [Desulfovibrionaceae bacterium]
MLPTTNPHICVACASQGPTCCHLLPGSEEHTFPLSPLEWQRILDHVPDKGFFAHERNSPAFLASLRHLFPGEHERVEALFPSHGEHLRLATRDDGDCAFRGPDGCILPNEVRPTYCRIFPFWVFGDRITLFKPAYCLAVRQARVVRALFDTMGMTEAEVRHLYGRLRLAWGLPPEKDMASPVAAMSRRKK